MFCKNCGNSMDPNAVVCVKCGVPVGKGANYCPNCGAETVPEAAMCVKCGASLSAAAAAAATGESKYKLTAGLLGIFLGSFGIHNFYLGYTKKAVIQIIVTLVTCGAAGLWGFIEGILILCGSSITTDANGNPLV